MSAKRNDISGRPAGLEEDLLQAAPVMMDERRDAGLEGLVGGLDAAIITTEHDHFLPAAAELLRYTGLSCTGMHTCRSARFCTLSRTGSASVVLQARNQGANPFSRFNSAPAAKRLRNTRLETLVFSTPDIAGYVTIQRKRGVRFLTREPIELEDGLFIQTVPSRFTGNSLGFVEWHTEQRAYRPKERATELPVLPKPSYAYLGSIGRLDHAATRVRAQERNAAILEFLSLTNYHYAFSVYVRSLNSITSVTRRGPEDFAMVFTSGITPDTGASAAPGPTEAFIRNYGTRVHHIAFHTDEIEQTVATLGGDGLSYMLDLVGSPEEGLKQIFTKPSPHTMLVTEYIHRYGGFDGFFTKSNVERLTAATAGQ
ncbi:MAG: hypothetical protein A4E35_01326 [Methanoregula sp. PtaU1.Bin051]|nr:MAG: hypothetical protein A4E35_01326 [Methanoregula sp. PtaU1.Bin051]